MQLQWNAAELLKPIFLLLDVTSDTENRNKP